jgi:hypothetical protein
MNDAGAALDREDWGTAQSYYKQILELQPTHTAAQRGLQIASKKLELSRLYGQAVWNQDEGRLELALKKLRRIQGLDPNYRNVPKLILAIEAQLTERAQQKQAATDHASPIRLRVIEMLSTLPRKIWYLGGGVGLILMLIVGCLGLNVIFGPFWGTETPPPVAELITTDTPTVIKTPSPTNTLTTTPRSPTGTVTPSNTPSPAPTTATDTPTATATPTPTNTPSSTPTDTSTPTPTITPSSTPTPVYSPIAYYPLHENAEDATGNNDPMELQNVTFSNGSIYLNGYTYFLENGYIAITPQLENLNFLILSLFRLISTRKNVDGCPSL